MLPPSSSDTSIRNLLSEHGACRARLVCLSEDSQRPAHKIPHIASSLVSERDRVLHRLACSCSLAVCVWSQACMAGVRGILRQRQETRRVGPWMCAPSLPCMCTRRLLGLVDRSRTGSDPSCWGSRCLQRDIWLHQPLSPSAMHTSSTHLVAKGVRMEGFRSSLRLSGCVSCAVV